MQGETGRVVVGVLWLAMVVTVAASWSAGTRSVTTPPRPAALEIPSSYGRVIMATEFDSGPTLVDLYGNEIEQAVSDYRVNGGGSLYERHSPDTPVKPLKAPSL